MRLISHGGWCCGISTIYGFETSPDAIFEATEVIAGAENCRSHGSVYIYNDRWALPEQTALERLSLLVKKKLEMGVGVAARGMVEAVLTSGRYNFNNEVWNPVPQISVWGPVLETLGFKPVTEFHNSNSCNTVTVYHLVH